MHVLLRGARNVSLCPEEGRFEGLAQDFSSSGAGNDVSSFTANTFLPGLSKIEEDVVPRWTPVLLDATVCQYVGQSLKRNAKTCSWMFAWWFGPCGTPARSLGGTGAILSVIAAALVHRPPKINVEFSCFFLSWNLVYSLMERMT